jgi:hypothetical protein
MVNILIDQLIDNSTTQELIRSARLQLNMSTAQQLSSSITQQRVSSKGQ